MRGGFECIYGQERCFEISSGTELSQKEMETDGS